METIKLTISDETLRDGEQQVGLCFGEETKRLLAHQVAQTGVHQIAVMPAVHETEERLVKTLVAEHFGSKVAASTMMTRHFIDQSKDCGVEQIILFHAVSDRLLFLRDSEVYQRFADDERTVNAEMPQSVIRQVRQNMLDKVLEHLHYAAEVGLRICFAAEDASRADFDFLVDCIRAFAPYLEQFLLCDTIGILTPEKTYIWVHDLLQSAPQVPLAVHFHNDMGLALENTLQAVLAGAAGVSGTFGGIGERAGNVALEQVLYGLKIRFGWEVEGIDYDALAQVTNYFEQLGVRSHPPYSPQAQRHESGIHVHSLLRDRQSYSAFPHSQPEIWFGKFSGASSFQYLFEQQLRQPLARKQYEQLSVAIKAIAIQEKRSFSVKEVLELLEKGVLKI
jgi:benzylmalate synthase